MKAKCYSSNMEIFLEDSCVSVYHDDCIDFDYEENMDSIIEKVEDTVERHLTGMEKEELEEKTHLWVEAHSCEEGEEMKRITADSFGSNCPENWEEIADWMNNLIEDGEDPEEVWEKYCSGQYPDAPKAIMEEKIKEAEEDDI